MRQPETKQFLYVLRNFFENRFLYTYPAPILKMSKII